MPSLNRRRVTSSTPALYNGNPTYFRSSM